MHVTLWHCENIYSLRARWEPLLYRAGLRGAHSASKCNGIYGGLSTACFTSNHIRFVSFNSICCCHCNNSINKFKYRAVSFIFLWDNVFCQKDLFSCCYDTICCRKCKSVMKITSNYYQLLGQTYP